MCIVVSNRQATFMTHAFHHEFPKLSNFMADELPGYRIVLIYLLCLSITLLSFSMLSYMLLTCRKLHSIELIQNTETFNYICKLPVPCFVKSATQKQQFFFLWHCTSLWISRIIVMLFRDMKLFISHLQ